MFRRNMQRSALMPALFLAATLAGCATTRAQADPSVVRVEKKGDGFQLRRNGQPYFIKGAGGDGSKQLLHDVGGNSFRTWGTDGSQDKLDEAQKLGLTMTLGIWLGHKEHGFNYNDAAAVARQFEDAKKAIDKYKDHAALLLWGIGNEMESGLDNEPAVWKAVEQIGAYAKKVDPNHPTMTVVAEIGGNKVQLINQYCPSIDVIGINSYGGGPSIPARYKKAGGVKPYVITEFGPPGTWEVGKNEWDAAPELTSTQKAARYRETYEKAIANQPLCLGSYAFTWGNKQEATSTWFGLLLPDGSKLGAVDALSKLWGGTVANRAPEIASLKVDGASKVAPDSTVHVALNASDFENDPLKVEWVLQHDPLRNNTGGATEAAPPTYPAAIIKADARGADIKMPKYGGGYRVFAFIHDGQGSAAVGNVPLFVEGGGTPPPAAARRAQLPLAIYAEAGDAPYVPSGYMGNTAAIHMDANDATNPHGGTTCLKVEYTANDNWGGVVWQSPANDWGNAPGGYDLTGATKLTFWARGAKGGEKVTFQFGLLGRDKPFFDTAQGRLPDVPLTTEWKEYSIDLTGKDLTRIKTGFAWTIAGNGAPITFYLDDVKYE